MLLSRGKEAKGGLRASGTKTSEKKKGKGSVDRPARDDSELPPPNSEQLSSYFLRDWEGSVELEGAATTLPVGDEQK